MLPPSTDTGRRAGGGSFVSVGIRVHNLIPVGDATMFSLQYTVLGI
jgi:hypothetical protein